MPVVTINLCSVLTVINKIVLIALFKFVVEQLMYNNTLFNYKLD